MGRRRPHACLVVRGVKGCTKVDADLASALAGRSWHVHKGYPATTEGSGRAAKKVYLHRLVAGASDGAIIDHVNGDRLDARRANLRVATKSQNAANVGALSTSRSGVRGVVKRGGRWRSEIHDAGRTVFLGSFGSLRAAACAYDAAAQKLFGEYARPSGGCPGKKRRRRRR